MFGAAPGSAAGRSKKVVLAIAGFDPAVEIDAGPTVLLADLFLGSRPAAQHST